MERLKHMKDCLIACVHNQISGNLDQVDAKELGEAIDMIKDLEEAIYYHTITKAMHEEDEEKQSSKHQGVSYYTPMYYTPMHSGSHESKMMHMDDMNSEMKDSREGRSPTYRRMYMEGKQHKDMQRQMKELEDYMHELTNDIMEMIEDATPEEKQLLRQKIATLSTKIK